MRIAAMSSAMPSIAWAAETYAPTWRPCVMRRRWGSRFQATQPIEPKSASHAAACRAGRQNQRPAARSATPACSSQAPATPTGMLRAAAPSDMG